MVRPLAARAALRNISPLVASRMALVATAWTASGPRPCAAQKRSNTASVSSPRPIPASLRRPVWARPALIRTVSQISSVSFHQSPGANMYTTRRHEFEPRSITAT